MKRFYFLLLILSRLTFAGGVDANKYSSEIDILQSARECFQKDNRSNSICLYAIHNASLRNDIKEGLKRCEKEPSGQSQKDCKSRYIKDSLDNAVQQDLENPPHDPATSK